MKSFRRRKNKINPNTEVNIIVTLRSPTGWECRVKVLVPFRSLKRHKGVKGFLDFMHPGEWLKVEPVGKEDRKLCQKAKGK